MDEHPFTTSYDADSGTLTLAGVIDELSIDDLRRALDDATASFTRSVTVDVSGVDFLPSLGLGLLATSRGKVAQAGGELVIVTRKDVLAYRVLEISGIPFTAL